ncbi:MAG: DUF1552 domain-containing protein [Myxococcaceae bacterium]|jgi:hypothetical protein|nr:DUF1552 domain-containing protein [Myxococcaceae bacterium]
MTFKLSRRFFLKGAGASLALPWLEAMLPGGSRAQDMTSPKRFLAFYVPCGIRMNRWTPAATGTGFALTPILSPLAARGQEPSLVGDINVITGLSNRPARPDGPGDHASGTGAFITARHPFKTESTNIRNGISLDQVLANAWRGRTRFASLELGTDGGGSSGNCDSGYSCAYARNIAWASETQPLAKETNPQVLFDRLFGGLDPNQSQQMVEKRKRLKQSVLDVVKADADALKPRLGKTDQRKLDEYLSGVRELERRVQSEQAAAVCTPGNRPATVGDLRDRTRVMLDLIAWSFRCDLTRSSTFMLQNAGSGYVFSFLGLSDGHHSYSHHGGDAANNDALERIGTWEVEQFAYLARQLKAMQEPNGSSVLDNSLLFFSSEIEDGDSHSHDNMPILMAGRAGGRVAGGRHLRFSGAPSVANLFVSITDALGAPVTSFGDSTGPLPGFVTSA